MDGLQAVMTLHLQVRDALEQQFPDYEVVQVDGGSRTVYERVPEDKLKRTLPIRMTTPFVYQEFRVRLRGREVWGDYLGVFVIDRGGHELEVKSTTYSKGSPNR